MTESRVAQCHICGVRCPIGELPVHWMLSHGMVAVAQPRQRLIDLSVAAAFGLEAPSSEPAEVPLEVAVADQVAELTAGLEGFVGTPEWPRPPADLTRYQDAFASAAANCPHLNAVDLVYGREYHCPDCVRTFGIDELRRARQAR